MKEYKIVSENHVRKKPIIAMSSLLGLQMPITKLF